MQLLGSTNNIQIYASSRNNTFYKGQHNYFELRKKASAITDYIDVKIGEEEEFKVVLNSDTYTLIEITSTVNLYNILNVVIDGFSSTLNCAYGIDPITIAEMIGKPTTACIFTDKDRRGGGILLPSKILQSRDSDPSMLFPCNMLLSDTSIPMTEGSVVLARATKTLIIRNTRNEEIGRVTLSELEDEREYVYVQCDSVIGQDMGGGTSPRLFACIMEVFSREMNVNITSLQSVGDGYESINEGSFTITIGIRNLCPYDYAYYSLLLLGGNIKIGNYDKCEPTTKKIEMIATNGGKADLKMTFKVKNYATI